MASGYAHLCIKASFAINDIFLYFSLVISTYCPSTDTQIAISAVANSFMHGFTGHTSHNVECANACITSTFLHIQSHASKLTHTVLNNTIATYVAACCYIFLSSLIFNF